MQTRPIRIGTRGSPLALWQAEAVRDALAAADEGAELEIVVIRTSGDRIRDRALLEAGGKGLFTKEIDEALLAGDIAIAVHSAKDMPTALPDGMVIGACLARADVRDAFIGRDADRLDDLPQGATVGTASLRREALLRRARPDLRITLLRGNVETRLRKVEEGEYDATLLAAAGMTRLGLQERIDDYLPVDRFPPACGQGAVAIACRDDDAATRKRLAAVGDATTFDAVRCERAFLATLDGSCRTPIAGYAEFRDGRLSFSGIILSPNGQEFYQASRSGETRDAEAIGRTAGEEIRAQAPPSFLAALGLR